VTNVRIFRIFSSGISIFSASACGSARDRFHAGFAARCVHLADCIDHVHRDADRPRLEFETRHGAGFVTA
jgi:hypothetical protein